MIGETAPVSDPVLHAPLWESIQAYHSAMDGTKRDFSEVEHLFDAIYHDEYELILPRRTEEHLFDDEPISPCVTEVKTRDQVKEIHRDYFATGTMVTGALSFERVGSDAIDVSIQAMYAGHHLKTFHIIYWFRDGKIIRGQTSESLW